MSLNEQYDELEKYFGKSNLKFEYFFDSNLDVLDPKQYSTIKLTHIPSKKVVLGENCNTQIENAIDALKKLKSLLSD